MSSELKEQYPISMYLHVSCNTKNGDCVPNKDEGQVGGAHHNSSFGIQKSMI